MNNIGIEKISIYPGSLALELHELAQARGGDSGYIRESLMVVRRSLVPLWEDAVTLAVNSAKEMLTDADRAEIGLFIVATESGLDQEKAVSTWAHRYLELPSTCRVFELKSACHAGAAGLKMAESWISSGLNRGQKVLLINVDISNNMTRHGKMEYSLGAGAIALLISDQPDFAVIETGKSGIHTHEVTDVIRPLPWKEIAFDVEASLFSYLDGLESTFEEYCKQTPEAGDIAYFDHNIYHLPFPGISKQAHKVLLELQGQFGKEQLIASFEQKVMPSLYYPQQIGATYCGSIFLSLFSLIVKAPKLKQGDRIGIYSYGSGSCAEYFSVLVGGQALEIARQQGAKLDALLGQRKILDVASYEQLEDARSAQMQGHDYSLDRNGLQDWCAGRYSGSGRLILERIDNHLRSYRHA
ncbi:hydroxymethylglutaryl-coenzyme A synthase C terminal family protein [Collimonas fungivorans]|uniref:Hydroxymethylglutaryl-coenzyme A synthase C terminal family protein n=1 Tax=Collimonas fungivorans TaxID=158899 RepID=A0A127PA76_9BURK|nr:hydroxymethylglutaryl-CoA synthase family protein [Collimonas fungivorans]AMO94706.1 hydroxymethylglutaryl-coenzyme A synthase C terminal family protein [Collimonas fungivorans]